MLRTKYFYAGGSVRWMFGYSGDEFFEDFEFCFGKVEDYDAVLTGRSGDRHSRSVHHMRGLSKRGPRVSYFFISQHALNKFASKCDTKKQFIIAGYGKAEESKNPAFRGWIFEFDVDYQLSQAAENKVAINVSVRNRRPERWNVTKYKTFRDVAGIIQEVQSIGVG